MSNLLKQYYDAMSSGNEWSAVDAAEIKEKIDREIESASWTGREPNFEENNEMGG